MKKKSRMQNNSVINKRNKTPCRDHTQTMDHNNKRNNTMDCHPYIKKKSNEKKNWFDVETRKFPRRMILPKRDAFNFSTEDWDSGWNLIM